MTLSSRVCFPICTRKAHLPPPPSRLNPCAGRPPSTGTTSSLRLSRYPPPTPEMKRRRRKNEKFAGKEKIRNHVSTRATTTNTQEASCQKSWIGSVPGRVKEPITDSIHVSSSTSSWINLCSASTDRRHPRFDAIFRRSSREYFSKRSQVSSFSPEFIGYSTPRQFISGWLWWTRCSMAGLLGCLITS